MKKGKAFTIAGIGLTSFLLAFGGVKNFWRTIRFGLLKLLRN